MLKNKQGIAGLDGKGMSSHSHTPTPAILKTHVWYVTHLNYCMIMFPHLLMIHSFSTLFITLFSIVPIKSFIY